MISFCQDVFSFLFMIAGCLIMWAFNWANLHKFFPLWIHVLSRSLPLGNKFKFFLAFRLRKNISWYYISDPHWSVLFLLTYHELGQWTYGRREKLTKYRFPKQVLSPQAKFTWYFDLFHKHPCSFLIFEASILSELQKLHRNYWRVQFERENHLNEGRIIMGAAVLYLVLELKKAPLFWKTSRNLEEETSYFTGTKKHDTSNPEANFFQLEKT